MNLKTGVSTFVAIALFSVSAVRAGTVATPCADLREWRDDGAGAPLHWRNDGASAQIADDGYRAFAAALVSPSFAVPDGGLSLSWLQRRDLSWANSAGVLDVAVGDADWRDVTAVGGRFEHGDYDGRTFAGNPLGARAAWGPAAAVRFRLAPVP
jgi:hypothetical protein